MLTVQPSAGWYDVTGVAGDGSVAAPLGQRYFAVGPHLVGFDQRFTEPVLMRAYYDPAADPRFAAENRAGRALDRLGYVQATQVTYAGIPVPPELFGGRVADRWPYADGQRRFLDFMGPTDARLRGLDQLPPFYAYNGSLSDGTVRTTDDLFRHPRVNGSLYAPPTRPVAGLPDAARSAVASIVSEVATGFVTADDVAAVLDPDGLVLRLAPSAAQLAASDPYQLALAALRAGALPDDPADPPVTTGPSPIDGVTDDQIVVRQVGPYVLMTVPTGSPGFPVTYCVSVGAGNPPEVLVTLLSAYDIDDMESASGRDVLQRVGAWLEDQEELRTIVPPPAGDPDDPVLVEDARGLRCELRYWTFVVGARSRKRARGGSGQVGDQLTMISGFTWSALYRFHPDWDELRLTAFREPEPCPAFPFADLLEAFRDGLTPEFAAETIDVTNFTGASLRRSSFGTQAAVPVPFVDAAHRDIDTGAEMDLG